MAAGFHRFSGDGNLINFIAILRINIPGAHPGAEAAVGLLRGGGILGFGFMNIAGDPVGHLRAAGTFKLFPVFRANGVGRRGGDQRQGEGGEKPGLIHLIVSHRDSGVPGQREGYTLVYSPVGVRIK